MTSLKQSALLLATVAITLASCKKEIIHGKGGIVSEERSAANFSRIEIAGNMDVTVVQGNSFRVTVSDYENLVDDIEVRVTGDELKLGYHKYAWVTKGKPTASITMPSLKGLRLNGSGSFLVEGPFTAIPTFQIHVNGLGKVTVKNTLVEEASIKIAGSGDVYAFGLQANKASVDVEGSGNTELTANNMLNVNINGSGDVYYKGTATVNSSINGSGKVVKR